MAENRAEDKPVVKKLEPNRLVQRTEVKRLAENLTKKELCRILDIHYNFYWNVVNCTNEPSANMEEALKRYLETPTSKVYEAIFALRSVSVKKGAVKKDKKGKEIISPDLKVTKKLNKEILDDLTADNVYRKPKMFYED